MNIHNLKRMYNHILTVPEELLSMEEWRKGELNLHECNTIGCIIGHCVKLDSIENVPLWRSGNIDFGRWSEYFTDIEENSSEWSFIFSSNWAESKKTNSKAQILARLKESILKYTKSIDSDWKFNYSYIVINPEYLDQTPFEL